MSIVNQKQMDFFNENGYLVYEQVFDTLEVIRMQKEADYILELILNSSLANNRLSDRLDCRINPRGEQVVRKIQPINSRRPVQSLKVGPSLPPRLRSRRSSCRPERR